MLRRLFKPILQLTRPFYITDPCATPPTVCNLYVYQSLEEQRLLLLQLLNALLPVPLTIDELESGSANYICLSPQDLRAMQAQLVAEYLRGAQTAQPVCTPPQYLEAAITYLTCKLLNQLSGPQ